MEPRGRSPRWLSKLHRTRSSSKRSASPAIPQSDGSCFGKPEKAQPVAENVPVTPKMPAFLQQSSFELREKYAILNTRENERLEAGKRGAADPEFIRLEVDPVLDRYSNIYPWANQRVKLQVPAGVNDYINASPVSLVSTEVVQSTLKRSIQDKYICMQGPKRQTVDHVWHMIWHEISTPYNSSPAVVIMLSPTHAPVPDNPDKVFEKCYQYYPLDADSDPIVINENSELGDNFKATVSFVARHPGVPNTSIEVRELVMRVEGEPDEKTIWHYLYPDWPDFGALEEENVGSILALMELSRHQNGRGENARVVHCSAGVGRTGTFVALEFLLAELQGGAWDNYEAENNDNDPIYNTVDQLRIQRKTMVQAFDQFEFLYEVCKQVWLEKYPEPAPGTVAGPSGS